MNPIHDQARHLDRAERRWLAEARERLQQQRTAGPSANDRKEVRR